MRSRSIGLLVSVLVAGLATPLAIGQEVGARRGITEEALDRMAQRRAETRQDRLDRQPRQPRPLRSETVSGSSRPLPPPGVYDFSITGDMNLGGALFKDGAAFLHDEGDGVSVGLNALVSLTSGTYNTAVGVYALTNTTEGHGNTTIGDYAGRDNTTGSYNTAVGQYALLYNQFSSNNTAVGRSALRDWVGLPPSPYLMADNTAIGYSAMATSTIGFLNTAVGAYALAANVLGTSNTAIGWRALQANIGYDYGGDLTLGYNTAVGRGTLYSSTTGSSNTAIGAGALSGIESGERNIAVGDGAGGALTGSDSNNILLATRGTVGDNNTLRIGTSSLVAAYIEGIEGSSVDGASDVPVLIDNTGKLGTMASARRYKTEIESLGDRSGGLLELRPVSFRYKHDDPEDEAALRYGLIAEEVAEIYPELVVFNDEDEPETVKYHLLSAMLINELQRLRSSHDHEMAELRRRLEAVEGR